jgi:quinol monooxygenase YgiN
MIVVTGYLTIDPAKRAEVEAAIATLVPATVAEEGCVEYRYATDVLEPNRINIWEQWASEEAMNAHMGTSHLADFMGVMGTCIGGPLEITRHDVATSTKIF